MNDYGNRGSERGNIETRRSHQGISNLWDWEPFRGFLPGNWNQTFGIDVHRREDGYEVEIPVPGYKPQDIEVTFQDGVVTVSGKNDRRTFTRSLTVPDDIDEETITANVEHGVLTIGMRQHPQRQPRRITIGGQKTTQGGENTGTTTTGSTQTIEGSATQKQTSR